MIQDGGPPEEGKFTCKSNEFLEILTDALVVFFVSGILNPQENSFT